MENRSRTRHEVGGLGGRWKQGYLAGLVDVILERDEITERQVRRLYQVFAALRVGRGERRRLTERLARRRKASRPAIGVRSSDSPLRRTL